MNSETKQTELWRGNFGNAYVDRNKATEKNIQRVTRIYAEILSHTNAVPPASILEVGANIGINLRALARITSARLLALEPNQKARDRLIADNVIDSERIFNSTASDIPLEDDEVDLVFTSGVLIHIPEEKLESAYRQMHRVAGRYVLSIEYFSQTPVTVPYRGETEALFKRDFGGMWLDLFDDLEPVANGFFWRRTTGMDDLNWWLFRKR